MCPTTSATANMPPLEDNQIKNGMNNSKKVRILIGDDHVMTRLGLITFLDEQPDMTVVAEASDGRTALKLCAEERPDIALLDLHIPGLMEIEAIKLLRAKLTPVRVIVLAAMVQEEEVYRALEAGAHGFLPKNVGKDELLEAIRTVHGGGRWIAPTAAACLAERVSREELTSRELEILKLLPEGKSNKEISNTLVLSEETIKWHMKKLLEKLGTHDRTQAAVVAIQRGILKI